MATNILILLLHSLLLNAAAQPPPPPPAPAPAPEPSGCVEELVAFSPCLPFVSDPPNHATDTVPTQCCDVFTAAFESVDGYCFCYIFRQPLIFGFPMNKERLASLPSFCASHNEALSLETFCSSDAPALPPLPSTTDSGILYPYNPRFENDSSDSTYSPPESTIKPPTPPSPSIEEPMSPSATNPNPNQVYEHITWFLLGTMIFLA